MHTPPTINDAGSTELVEKTFDVHFRAESIPLKPSWSERRLFGADDGL